MRAHNFINLKGERFGRLLVLELDHIELRPNGKRRTFWKCLCDCGKITVVVSTSLRSGITQSCGCLKAERNRERLLKHGQAGTTKFKATKEYNSWADAKQRVANPNNNRFHCNGAKGKSMCKGWFNNYAAFFSALGNCPPGLSLHRIENELGYTCGQCEECKANGWPMNCKWDTAIVQANTKSPSRFLEFRNKRMTIAEWGRFSTLNPQYIYHRLDQGWEALKIFMYYLPLTSDSFRLWFAQAESP